MPDGASSSEHPRRVGACLGEKRTVRANIKSTPIEEAKLERRDMDSRDPGRVLFCGSRRARHHRTGNVMRGRLSRYLSSVCTDVRSGRSRLQAVFLDTARQHRWLKVSQPSWVTDAAKQRTMSPISGS